LVRTSAAGTLVVLHTFASEVPEEVEVPVKGAETILDSYRDASDAIVLENGVLRIKTNRPWMAMAVLLK
ncbi:MAG: hypothetical protein II051_08330, partial [Lachnospiraceae bacterium]|nr:hypothetical protein [Lachnospiraceae bacterium]